MNTDYSAETPAAGTTSTNAGTPASFIQEDGGTKNYMVSRGSGALSFDCLELGVNEVDASVVGSNFHPDASAISTWDLVVAAVTVAVSGHQVLTVADPSLRHYAVMLDSTVDAAHGAVQIKSLQKA